MVNNGFQTVEPTSQFDDILRQFLDTPGILAAIDRLRPTHPVAHPPDPAPVRTVGTVMVTAEHANRAEANRQRAVACRELIDSTPAGSPTYLSPAWLSDNSSTPPSGSPVWRPEWTRMDDVGETGCGPRRGYSSCWHRPEDWPTAGLDGAADQVEGARAHLALRRSLRSFGGVQHLPMIKWTKITHQLPYTIQILLGCKHLCKHHDQYREDR